MCYYTFNQSLNYRYKMIPEFFIEFGTKPSGPADLLLGSCDITSIISSSVTSLSKECFASALRIGRSN